MAPCPLALSPSYLAVARGIRALHHLALAGQDESPEADAVRDATDAPWKALTEVERRRASGLSADLYSISDPPKPGRQPMSPQAQAGLADVLEARRQGEWDRALELVRRWAPSLPPALVSHLRGSIWLEVGDPATAALFFDHAADLEPRNGNDLALALHALHLSDPAEALRRAQRVLDQDAAYAVAAVGEQPPDRPSGP